LFVTAKISNKTTKHLNELFKQIMVPQYIVMDICIEQLRYYLEIRSFPIRKEYKDVRFN